MMRRTLLALTLLLAATGLAAAEDGGVRIDRVWSRTTPSGAKAAAVYMTLTSSAPDRLVGASTPVAASATTHSSASEGGVMRMRAVDAIPLDPDKPVELAPGGLHVMLEGLKQPLKEGHSFPLTLRFEHAGEKRVDVKVEK